MGGRMGAMTIAFAMITSEATRGRLAIARHWTCHIAAPHTLQIVGDAEAGGKGDYLSAIDKTLHAIAASPPADWLYIVDDDGYVVTRRLEAELSRRDPGTPACLGHAATKLVCEEYDINRKFRGIHGGPGFALSWSAVRLLKGMIAAGAIIRHKRNSDATVAIALDRLGIIPEHDDRWFTAIPNDEDKPRFVACHRLIDHPAHLEHLPALDAQQARLD